MKKTKDTNNFFLNTMKHHSYIKNELHDINRPNIYLRDVSGILYPEISWWFSN